MAISSYESVEIKKIVTLPSSGSEGCSGGGRSVDEKKRRRMESNRESARRSRQRKQKHMDDMIKQVGSLERENEEFGKKIREFSGVFATMEAQNGVLKEEKDRLAAKLESLEGIIEIAKVVNGSGNGGGECLYEVSNDPMMKPWKLPRSSLPIVASSGLRCFNFGA